MSDLTVFTLRWSRNVSREYAKREKRACAQTSGVESNKRSAETMSGSRLVSSPTDLLKACMLQIVFIL